MDTNDHKRSQPSQQKPASSQQSPHGELLRGLVLRYAVTVIYRNQQRKKRFSVHRKKEQSQKKKNNDDFRESRYF